MGDSVNGEERDGENEIIPACGSDSNCDRKMKYWSWSILMDTKNPLNT